MRERLILIVILAFAVFAVLSPWLVNGAPYIGDAWIHLKKAEDIIARGRLRFEEYNDMWPLVNLIIAFYSTVLNLPPLMATQIIPFLVSLSTINLYIISSRISRNSYAAFSTCMALILIPLYTFITFGSAVMKETAAFYISTLLIAYLLVSSHSLVCSLLLSFGLVVGHHFASLALFILLLSVLAEDVSDLFGGDVPYLKRDLVMASVFGVLLFSWSFFVLSKVGWFLPVTGNTLLTAMFAWFGVYVVSRMGRSSPVVLQALLIPLAALAWRGCLHDIPTPVNPISIWEVRDLIIFMVPALMGLAFYWRDRVVRAMFVSTTTLIVFSLVSGLDHSGLIVFTKSLHYYCVFLALVFGLSWSLILRKRFGSVFLVLASVCLVLASIFGISFALNGPGAYHGVEYMQLEGLRDKLGEPLVMDLKLYYLSEYLDVKRSIFHKLGQDEYVLLTRSNLVHGVLLGYIWVDLSLYMPYHVMFSCDRLFDGGYLRVLRVNNV